MSSNASPPDADEGARPACPAPADFRAEIAAYDAQAEVGQWQGPRHRMTYRVLGAGPPLILLPGIASTYRGYALTLNRLAARFRTIVLDYPGDNPDDTAQLASITHENLVDDVFDLIEHLRIGRVFLVGTSFGSTVTLGALLREPRRFPKAVLQGAFAHRQFSFAEKLALAVGRRVPGTIDRLPLRRTILEHNSKNQFPRVIADRWPIYLEQNGLTPIAGIAHRTSLLTRLDLRPKLAQIPVEILLLHGNEDRIVRQSEFDLLRTQLPGATGVLMPLIGHQPHFTHAEVFAQAIEGYLLPCAPEGCPSERNEPAR
ncbi:alpha/beta hydrolase [Isosphaeraceae bacterium EP7]